MTRSQDQFLDSITSTSSIRIGFLVPWVLIFTSVIYFFVLNKIDICNCAGDTNPYNCHSNVKSVLEKLEDNPELVTAWFEMKYMKLNTDKCHLSTSQIKKEYLWAKLDQDIVWGKMMWNLLELQQIAI